MNGLVEQTNALWQHSAPVMILFCSHSIAVSSWRTRAAQKSMLSTSPAARNLPSPCGMRPHMPSQLTMLPRLLSKRPGLYLLILNAPSQNVWALQQCCCQGASHGRTSAAPLLQVVGRACLASAGLIGSLCSMQPAVGSVPLPEQLIHRLQPVCRHLSVRRRLRD